MKPTTSVPWRATASSPTACAASRLCRALPSARPISCRAREWERPYRCHNGSLATMRAQASTSLARIRRNRTPTILGPLLGFRVEQDLPPRAPNVLLLLSPRTDDGNSRYQIGLHCGGSLALVNHRAVHQHHTNPQSPVEQDKVGPGSRSD